MVEINSFIDGSTATPQRRGIIGPAWHFPGNWSKFSGKCRKRVYSLAPARILSTTNDLLFIMESGGNWRRLALLSVEKNEKTRLPTPWSLRRDSLIMPGKKAHNFPEKAKRLYLRGDGTSFLKKALLAMRAGRPFIRLGGTGENGFTVNCVRERP